MEEKKETVVVTPSGRVTTETDPEPMLEGAQVVESTGLDDIEVVYDQPGDEIDPAILDQYYEMAKAQAAMVRPRRFVPKSIHTKHHQSEKTKKARAKLQKKSRKANRRKK